MSKHTPGIPVDNLSAICLEATSEDVDWGEVNFYDDEATCYVAEQCDECGELCVMPYVGQDSHRNWLRSSREDDDYDADDAGEPVDAYEIPFVVGMNVEPYLPFHYRVDELGDAVPIDPPKDSIEDFPEIDGTPGRVDEIDGDVVWIVFEGIEPRVMLAGLDDDWSRVQIVEDDVYESLKKPEKPSPKTCTATLYNEGPMMNFRYEIDLYRAGSPEAAARAVSHLPVCIVEMNDTYYLALTGGGMDLSWELCEAYMCLGLLPPASLTSLPRYHRPDGLNDVQKWVVRGCIRSCEILKDWQEGRIRSLREMLEVKESV